MLPRSALQLVRSAALPALALFVIAHFAGYALFGPNGLTALGGYRAQRAQHSAELQRLRAERDRLAHHVALLDPARVDPDYADELIRRQTGQVRPDEVIIPRD